MMYPLFSPERAHTRPSRFASKRRVAAHRSAQRRDEVMSFSVDFLPGWSDERGSAAPVYVASAGREPMPIPPFPSSSPWAILTPPASGP